MPINFTNFIRENPLVLVALIVWCLIWKGLALWRAGRLGQKCWFIVILILNTVGLLEILYLFIFSKKCCCPKKEPSELQEK